MAKNKEKKNKKQGNNAEKHKPVNNETLNDQKHDRTGILRSVL